MPKPTICPVCGGELEGPHVRFHHGAKPFTDDNNPGHYVDGSTRDLQGGMAPAPPERPKLPKGMKALLEEDVRLDGIGLMRKYGYAVYDLEQGHRPERGGARVAVGFPDCYFQGHMLRGFIEFKRPDGKPARHPDKHTPEQKAFEREELKNGGIYLLVEHTRQLKEWHEAQKGQLEVEL
jgi:hypothetical protein